MAAAFNQLLIMGKKGSLTWMQAENLKWKPIESLKSKRGHSFIVMDKVDDGGSETWERGLLIDLMDNKVVFLQEYAPSPVNPRFNENYRTVR